MNNKYCSVFFPLILAAFGLSANPSDSLRFRAAPPVNTYTSTDVPKAIATNSVVLAASTITVSSGGTITDVNVKSLAVTHTYVVDLKVFLTSPEGTTVQLIAPRCGSNDNILENFDDSGTAYASMPCPMTNNGNYQPYSPLSVFNNENSTGTWTLTVLDNFSQDGGSLTGWGLEITTTAAEVCGNGLDDDGDSLVDAADLDCQCTGCGTSLAMTYFIPYPEDEIYNSIKTIYPSFATCGVGADNGGGVFSYVSVNPYLDGTIVIYDHWEDGYETDLSYPTQSSTQIWGDNNMANGFPPGFTTDYIGAGDQIVVYKPIDPNNLTVQDYDGGDQIGSNYPVSVSRHGWIAGSETLLAGTIEASPTIEWGTTYTVPMGQNFFTDRQYFQYVGMSVMAGTDETTVQVDADANGAYETTVTLDKGETYFANGGLNLGAKVLASSPVQVHLITGDVCDNYESRWFSLAPTTSWGSAYYNPVSGNVQEIQIYNPNAVSITIKRRLGTGFLSDLTVAAGSATRFTAGTATGYHLYSSGGQNFAAFVLHDAINTTASNNDVYDWGGMLASTTDLSQVVLVGYAPGHDPTVTSSENSSPVWYTVAIPGNTLAPTGIADIDVCIDYNGDGVGSLTDSYGRQYDLKQTVAELSRQIVYDPDGDQSNMVLYVCNSSTAIISAFWGEANTASAGTPGLDMGRALPSINPFFASKSYVLDEVCPDGIARVGDTITYTLSIQNPGLVRITGFFNIADTLPTAVNYIANTTTRKNADGSISTVSDNSTGTPFPLDETGQLLQYFTLDPGQTIDYSFQTIINSVPSVGYIYNRGMVNRYTLTYRPSVITPVYQSIEICDNNCDDDGDGNVDCLDSDCTFSLLTTDTTICVGNPAQVWATASSVETVGVYSFTAKHSSKCVDLSGSYSGIGGAIIQYTCHSGSNQKWQLIPTASGNGSFVSGGRYYIRSESSKKFLYPQNGSATAGTAIVQSLGTSTLFQWDFILQGDGSYRIQNASTGLSMQIAGASTADNAALQQGTWTSADNQKFNLTLQTASMTFSWDNSLGTGQVLPVTPSLSTKYNVTATAANGCTKTNDRDILVTPSTGATIAGATTICTGGTASLTSTLAIPCPGYLGAMTRQQWNGISGTAVSNLTGNANYPNSPTTTENYFSTDGPVNSGDNYGTRVQAYLQPTISGNYKLAIYSDDASELWLSTTNNPANKVSIASVPGYTNVDEITKYPSQQSANIALVAGQSYYLEVLQKESGGGDHWGLHWQIPSGGSFVQLPRANLTSYNTTCPSFTFQWQSSANGSTGWTNVAGGTSQNLTTPALSSNTYFRVLTSVTGNPCPAVASGNQLVTVVADPAASVVTNAGVVCTGGGVQLTATPSGGTGSCNFQWQSSPNGTTWTDISGATNSTFNTPSLSSQTRYRVIYSCSGNGCCN